MGFKHIQSGNHFLWGVVLYCVQNVPAPGPPEAQSLMHSYHTAQTAVQAKLSFSHVARFLRDLVSVLMVGEGSVLSVTEFPVGLCSYVMLMPCVCVFLG